MVNIPFQDHTGLLSKGALQTLHYLARKLIRLLLDCLRIIMALDAAGGNEVLRSSSTVIKTGTSS